jgi:PAS domain-containing protein
MATDRLWTRELGRLRVRAAKLRRRPSGSAAYDDVFNAALEMCEGLLRELAGSRVASDALTRRLNEEANAFARLFDHLPVAAIKTDRTSLILTANREAALLLNMSTKHLISRVFLHFAEDRAGFVRLLSDLSEEQPPRRAVLRVRPRERAPLNLTATILPQGPSTLVWFLAAPLARMERAARRDQKTAAEP